MFLDFIDEIYVINLPERIDRRAVIESHLSDLWMPYTIYPGIKDENGVKGLFLTMQKLMAEVVRKRQRNVMVLEDDAKFLVDPTAFLRQVLPQLPKDYWTLHLGLNLLSRPIRMSENILKITDCYSTHAIIYSYDAAKFLCDRASEAVVKPYDIYLREELLPSNRCYCTYPMLATQRPGHSNIENKEIDWGALMTMTYAMHTKNI